MHLPHGESAIHFGSVSGKTTEDTVPSNGTSKLQQIDQYMKNPDRGNDQPSKSNEVRIPLPRNWTSDEVLDTILTAWTILIERYQRDLFHQFTWGLRDAGKDCTQCIPTTELDLSNQNVAKSLISKIGGLRSKDYTINEGSKLSLNDGTSAEVCKTMQHTKHH
jgi:hypothetical protein